MTKRVEVERERASGETACSAHASTGRRRARILALLAIFALLGALAGGGLGCNTTPPEPYPQSHLRLLGVHADLEGEQPISILDFGKVSSGYSEGILIPVYIENKTDQRLAVTAHDGEECPGDITLEAAPPKFYTETHIDTGHTEKFLLRMDWVGTITPQEYAFEITISAEWEDGGGFDIVFPAKLMVIN